VVLLEVCEDSVELLEDEVDSATVELLVDVLPLDDDDDDDDDEFSLLQNRPSPPLKSAAIAASESASSQI